jgi:hypothetical protein
MILRRLVAFSGFDARLVEGIRPELEAQQVDVAVVKLWPALPLGYFEKLLERTAALANRQFTDPDVRIVALLVSCVADKDAIEAENEVFWPMLRRLAISPSLSHDIRRAPALATQIISLMTNPEFLSTYERIKPAADATLALPLRNASNARLTRELKSLYELTRFQPTASLGRFVQRLKGRRGLRTNGIDFRGCQNDPRHPVRRMTDSLRCDLSGRFRLGFSVPPRFEFDVSCETGIAGKTFELCDGKRLKVPARASHLNMRINDDFDW